MYWRVRRVSPEQVVKTYGVHACLAVSLLVNGFLLITRPNPQKQVSGELKTNLDVFARNVTQHILDTSYISYESSTRSLLPNGSVPGELAPPVVTQLKAREQLPKTLEDLRATARTLESQRQVSAVRIDSVNQGEPDEKSLVPLEVTGMVAIHSADESVSGNPVGFKFMYKVGMAANPNNPEQKRPIVVEFRDLSAGTR
ncbi:MAG: hypothetical protein K2Y39_28690 [Candidatus Obscuribacterales bacterium]|nr:hypothetical protein [Candidatus Obscuribacterales bacterium]